MATTTRTTTNAPNGLSDALVRLSHLVRHVFADVSREHELSPQQAQLLGHLTRGPVGMTELSRSMHLEKSSLTGLVDRVERRGLVTRTRDGRDRRACQVALTEHGTELAYAVHRGVLAQLDTLTSQLPSTTKDHLSTAIAQILSAG